MNSEFRACGVCTQTCFKEHGAHDASQAPPSHFTRPPCFLLTSLEVSNNWTPLPKEFVEAHGESLRGTARILGANGKEWTVEVGGPAKFLGFKGGWKSFIASTNIKRGDQMLFSLVSKNCFSVHVFSKLGVEVVPVAPPKSASPAIGKRKRPEVKAEPVSDVSDSDEESEYEGSSDDEPSSDSESEAEAGDEEVAKKRIKRKFTGSVEVKKKKALTSKTKDGTPIEPGSMTTTYESRRRKVTQAELDRTLVAAQAFEVENPSCTIVMKPSHVYRGFWLNIPKQFARKYLPLHKTEIILQDIHGFEWPKTVWIQNDHHTGLSGGWAGFSKDHSLEEGDVCIYEIIDSKDVRILVHIFRAVNVNLVPGTRGGWEKTYNIVYGAGMNRQGNTQRRRIAKRKPEKRKKGSLSEGEDLVDDVPLSKLYKEKQLDGNSDITSEEDVKPKILSMKPIPKMAKVKQEPGTAPASVKVKQEPGIAPVMVKVKPEPGLMQEHGEDVKPSLAQLQASLKCEIKSSDPVVGAKIWYAVVQMLGRRQSSKFPDQHEFLVSFEGRVAPPSESSSICEDGNGNWWVPRSHFSPDLATCYFD